jgi:hypothetical protein
MHHHSIKSPWNIKPASGVPQRRYDSGARGNGDAVGNRDGFGVTLIPSEGSKAAARNANARRNPVAQQNRAVTERRVATERPIKPMPLDEIERHVASMRTAQYDPKPDITRAARHILLGEDAGLPDTSEGNKKRLLAFHLALQCLGPDVDEQTCTALLSPVGPFTRQPQAIAEHLQTQYPSGDEELEAMVEVVIKFKGGDRRDPKATEKHKSEAEELLRERYGDKLMKLLATWLDIPSIDADREERRDRVLNDLARFTTDNQHGQRALKGLNTAQAFKTTPDPVRSQAAYIELSEALSKADQTAVQAMLLLMKDPSLDLEDLATRIKEQTRAASDDMNADNPSNEANKLWATVTELGNLRIENTIVPLFERTAKRVSRAITSRGASSAAAA